MPGIISPTTTVADWNLYYSVMFTWSGGYFDITSLYHNRHTSVCPSDRMRVMHAIHISTCLHYREKHNSSLKESITNDIQKEIKLYHHLFFRLMFSSLVVCCESGSKASRRRQKPISIPKPQLLLKSTEVLSEEIWHRFKRSSPRLENFSVYLLHNSCVCSRMLQSWLLSTICRALPHHN